MKTNQNKHENLQTYNIRDVVKSKARRQFLSSHITATSMFVTYNVQRPFVYNQQAYKHTTQI
jgi:hypothetical protein